ncbi:hypothetical protein ACFLWV_03850 [Chloroflexota bacterium]
MEALIWMVLGILGGALIVGGIVAYRGSKQVNIRAFSAAAVASGAVMWAIVSVTIPVSSASSGPLEPAVQLINGPNQAAEISLAHIHEVQINIAESYPPQVLVYIKGGLSDSCTTYHDLDIQRDKNTIEIEVTTERPEEVACDAVYSQFEKYVNLGTDFISGETYTIKVNDYTTTFVMQ